MTTMEQYTTDTIDSLVVSLRRSCTRWKKAGDAADVLQSTFDVEERLGALTGEEPVAVITFLADVLGWPVDDVYCGLAWYLASRNERRRAQGDVHASGRKPVLRTRAANGDSYAKKMLEAREKPSKPARVAMSPEERAERRREAARAKRREPGYRNRRVDERTSSLEPFVWVDGETTMVEGKHQLVLMRVGKHVLHHDGAPLNTEEVLSFIWEHRSRFLIGFRFASFDVTMMLQSAWPFLADEERFSVWQKRNVRIGNYFVMLTPEKTVRIHHVDCGHPGDYGHGAVIHDVWGMLGRGHFLNAVERWEVASPEELAELRAGKARRQHHEVDDEMLRYSQLEAVLAERMMEKVRRKLRSRYILPRALHSHGQLGSAILNRESVNAYRPERHNEMEHVAELAYYAGSAELVAQGWTVGPMTTYDINSAFPSAMRNLPCLRHGQWVHSDTLPKAGQRSFVRVAWNCPKPNLKHSKAMLLAPFPWRQEGGTTWWPLKSTGGGWYGDAEVRAAMAIWPGRITVSEVWTWEPSCDAEGCSGRPFAFIDAYYAMRASAPSAVGKLIKGALVSLYGRVSQERGEKRPPYYQPEWAAWTTSDIRAEILKAAALAGRRLLCTATDCIAVEGDVQLCLPLGDGLGDWKREVHPRTFFLTPNLAWQNGHIWRGSGLTEITPAMVGEVEAFFRGDVEDISIYPIRRFVTLGDALYNGREQQVGQWVTVDYTFPDFGIGGREHVHYGPWYEGERDSVRLGTVQVERAKCRSHGKLSALYNRKAKVRASRSMAGAGCAAVTPASTAPASAPTTKASCAASRVRLATRADVTSPLRGGQPRW